jgi:hypothetical protein
MREGRKLVQSHRWRRVVIMKSVGIDGGARGTTKKEVVQLELGAEGHWWGCPKAAREVHAVDPDPMCL